MRIAHVAVVTPGRCGLYETTRELAKALRDMGADSRLVEPETKLNVLHPGLKGEIEDRGVPFADLNWARGADVIANHSGLGEISDVELPVLHIAHGRPRHSFLSEVSGSTPIYSYHYGKNKDPRWKVVVTFWPQHIPYLQVMYPDKPVVSCTAPVDFDAWTIEGPSGYKFGGHKGDINVVCTDAWRDDVDPYDAINAVALWARTRDESVKLHCYGSTKFKERGWAALFKRLSDDGVLGECKGWVNGLDNVYRAASFMATPHEIDTRSVREAMACGCPVVRCLDLSGDGMTAALQLPRDQVRMEARALFDPKRSAREFYELAEVAA